MPGDPVGVWSGTSVPSHPPIVLGQTMNGSSFRRVLWGGVKGVLGGDVGRSIFPHHS